MKVGDKVKVCGIGGIYASYADWAELIGAERWVSNKYPKSMEFVIKEIAPHIDESITLYLLSSEEGDFIFDAVHSEITVKPRTRIEYEKVAESIFDLRDEFERGELHESLCGSKLENEHDFIYAYTHDHLVRKVEKEIDWQDEVVRFMAGEPKIGKQMKPELLRELNIEWDHMTDGDFLEMCRVALSANGEIE